MPTPTFTDIQNWLRRNQWTHASARAFGPSWVAIKIIGGLAVVTAIVGFLTEHPAVGITLAAVFFFYALRAFDLLESRWKRDSLEHKLLFMGGTPEVAKTSETGATVVCNFYLRSNADYDLYYVIDDEDFSVGSCRVVPKLTTALGVIPARTSLSLSSDPIPAGFPIPADAVNVKMSIRYGRKRSKLEGRLFVAGEIYLPVTGRSDPIPKGFFLRRNDFEWVS
jgi:hypothetical protein